MPHGAREHVRCYGLLKDDVYTGCSCSAPWVRIGGCGDEYNRKGKGHSPQARRGLDSIALRHADIRDEHECITALALECRDAVDELIPISHFARFESITPQDGDE